MSLFQPSVLKSHLALLDQHAVDKAYKKFSSYFLNATIQENIKTIKEEQFQATFLAELFVNVFHYTLFPNKNHNLITEQKNETNSRKADGAILNRDAVTAVIELKGTNTKDLESIRKQAFDYKNFNTGCTYVITSNFEKLRFYIDDASVYEEFDLFTLSRKRFELLYLCLNKDSLLAHTPKTIKEQSLVAEAQITKEFYKDYSLFKRELWKDLAKNNLKSLKLLAAQQTAVQEELVVGVAQEHDDDLAQLEKNLKRTLFKKSQKLIDRFLFIFFAEDRGLLQPNYTLNSIAEWETVNKLGVAETLYDRFKLHFNYLDTGRKKADGVSEIFAYNGGLFKPDMILDSVVISNELLLKHTKKIAAYDFESQVDVNILGHIFENSLNEIESVNAEIEGGNFDKQTSKRKKDGVFYTPKYITKYIVDNTLGKLCADKKAELGFAEEEYYRGRKNRQESTLKNLLAILDDYRAWLLQLTICDPACGSGAFLNQALDFLINEHNYLDDLKARLLGGSIALSDIENTILENNIYGVDLNEESVEIAKLSLWLRTAQPRRKLNDLSSNIQCGNSLIDVKAVAGDKAFKWEERFPQVFAKGGFDVVIGNPPYVSSKGNNFNDKEKEYYYNKYTCASYQIDLYLLFNELPLKLLKQDGMVSYIQPNAWLNNLYLKGVRQFLLNSYNFLEIVDTPNGVFKDATVDTLIVFWKIRSIKEIEIILSRANNGIIEKYDSLNQNSALTDENFLINIYSNSNSTKILDKIAANIVSLDSITLNTSGIKEYEFNKGLPPQTKETLRLKPFNTKSKIDENHKKHLSGIDLERYIINWQGNYLNYGEWIAAPRSEHFFNGPRLVIREIPSKKGLIVSYVEEEFTVKNTAHTFKLKSNYTQFYKPILAILNSRCMGYYFKNRFAEYDDVFPKAKIGQCKELPINLNISPNSLLDWDAIITKHIYNLNFIREKKQNFRIYCLSNLFEVKLSRKLESWHELTFGDFLKELNKAIKATNKARVKEGLATVAELTKKDEFEWMELFEEKQKEVQALQSQIQQTEQEIDRMVYELYGLSNEEIAIVEAG